MKTNHRFFGFPTILLPMSDPRDQHTRSMIRFRAWDRDTNILYTWDCFEDYPLKEKNATVPQEFTGFYDKNGKMIYLGDIVNYCNDNYLVRFLDGGYIFYKLENRSTLSFHWFHVLTHYQREMEVVGNTHDNADYILSCLQQPEVAENS